MSPGYDSLGTRTRSDTITQLCAASGALVIPPSSIPTANRAGLAHKAFWATRKCGVRVRH